MIFTAGSRGVRSRWAPARPAPDAPVLVLAPAPALAAVLPASAPSRARVWIMLTVAVMAGALFGNMLYGVIARGGQDWSMRPRDVGLGLVALVLVIIRHRLAEAARPRRPAPAVARTPAVPAPAVTAEAAPGPGSDLDQGVREIRRTDRGFDPTRFVGYTGMMFRDAHTAWMTRDVASLRERLTPEMYGALEAQCERLRSAGRSNRVAAVEVRTEITEAWQEGGRDFVTAYIVGSMIDYTVDDASGAAVDGSRTLPRDVNEFWTFTRPAGLNFWMLSAIQTS